MFRFVLQTAFIRRLLQVRLVRYGVLLLFCGALVAGLIYAYVFLNAANERSHSSHVYSHSSH
jgi:hypothetical protein